MARLQNNPSLPQLNSPNYANNLNFKLDKLFKDTAQQVNQLTEGKIAAVTNASTAAPTTGTYAQGDFIRNSEPSELGLAMTKYVITGWICVTSGTPGTWVQCRSLTGN